MITIPSKSDKQLSVLVDALRLLAWQQFKLENKEQVNGKDAAFKAYKEQFAPEWEEHELNKMDLAGIQKFISKLGYTEEELLEKRSAHYERRSQFNNNNNNNNNGNNNNSTYDEALPF